MSFTILTYISKVVNRLRKLNITELETLLKASRYRAYLRHVFIIEDRRLVVLWCGLML
jgi:hypothetical protein